MMMAALTLFLVPDAAQCETLRRRAGTFANAHAGKVPVLRRVTLSAFTRVFDALWCRVAPGARGESC